jgi:L-rhamnose mutarotase
MESICFCLKIKKDKLNEYVDIHKKGQVWESVLNNFRNANIKKLKIFMLENTAILYMESPDIKKAFESIGQQESQLKWNQATAAFMDTQPNYGSDKIVDDLPCIFNFEDGEQKDT